MLVSSLLEEERVFYLTLPGNSCHSGKARGELKAGT